MQARLWQQERTPDEPDFTDALASGAGSMATFFIPGVGIAKGAGDVARIGPRMAAWAGAGASGVMEAAVEAGGVYEDTLLKTKDINEAEKAASKTFWWNVPLVVFTNKLGFLGETGGAIKRGIVLSQVEGFQELVREYISTSSKAEKATLKDLLTAYGVGALTGGAAGAISAATDTKGVAPAPAELAKRLESSIIESSNPDGTIIKYTGGRFSYGIGRDAKGADAALRTSKEVRERAGERGGRGNKPIGLGEVAKGQRMGGTGGGAWG